MPIVIASCNAKKIEEFKLFYRPLPIEFIPQEALSIPDIEETGLSFVENAILKARHASGISGLPAVGDDSGLIVDALGGAPGIYSARYAPTDEERIAKLLYELADVPEAKRTARFYSAIVYLGHDKDPMPMIYQGSLEGRILIEPRGKIRFTYEPIFYLPSHQCSVAELSLEEKIRISHRGKAMSQLYRFLEAQTSASNKLS